jgi:CheY-like chemotaxis protein
MIQTPDKPHILLVEDNSGDVDLVKLAFQTANLDCRMTVLPDGEIALAYIHRDSPPDLVILDVNLPKHDGLEILEVLRATPGWQTVKVLTLTSSSSPRELARLREIGVTRHVTKPLSLDEFLKIGTVVKEILKGPAIP